jgi:tetratricopeptide (TPR) repeat protein
VRELRRDKGVDRLVLSAAPFGQLDFVGFAMGKSRSGVAPLAALIALALLLVAVGVFEFYQARRFAQVTKLAKQHLDLTEQQYGPNHSEVGQSLHNLAMLYHAQARYAEAEALYKRALAITEKALGPDHFSVAIRLSSLAELYRSQERTAEAEPLLGRAQAVAQKR